MDTRAVRALNLHQEYSDAAHKAYVRLNAHDSWSPSYDAVAMERDRAAWLRLVTLERLAWRLYVWRMTSHGAEYRHGILTMP